jgi:hypothetical protein
MCKMGSTTLRWHPSWPRACIQRLCAKWRCFFGGPNGSYLRAMLGFNCGDGDPNNLGFIGRGTVM